MVGEYHLTKTSHRINDLKLTLGWFFSMREDYQTAPALPKLAIISFSSVVINGPTNFFGFGAF